MSPTVFADALLGVVAGALPYIGGAVAAGAVVLAVWIGVRKAVQSLRMVAYDDSLDYVDSRGLHGSDGMDDSYLSESDYWMAGYVAAHAQGMSENDAVAYANQSFDEHYEKDRAAWLAGSPESGAASAGALSEWHDSRSAEQHAYYDSAFADYKDAHEGASDAQAERYADKEYWQKFGRDYFL